MSNKPLHQMNYEELLEYCRDRIRKYVKIDLRKTAAQSMEDIRLEFHEIQSYMNSHTGRLRIARESSERGREILLAEIQLGIQNREEKYKDLVPKEIWEGSKKITDSLSRTCALTSPEYKEFIQLRAQLIGQHQEHVRELDLLDGIKMGIQNQTPKRQG